MKIKASDYVALSLNAKGVTHVFELVGGMITHLLDSIKSQTDIKIVSCHHEQSAGFAAEGYSRVTGQPGVALATSGPGATNLLTAIGSCYFDSTPAVFITGQVNTYEIRRDKKIRQLGFQETDIISIASPLCKWAVQVEHAQDLPRALDEAFRISLTGRQGPCLIDLPMDVQGQEIQLDHDFDLLFAAQNSVGGASIANSVSEVEPLERKLRLLIDSIDKSKAPLLLMGGGCSTFANRQSSTRISKRLSIPVVVSLMGVDILPFSDPNRVGFIGSYGNRWANKVLGESDFLLVIGSRLDIRQTGSNIESFCDGKQIWQIDIDSQEIGLRVHPDMGIRCSIQTVDWILNKIDISPGKKHSWTKRIQQLKDCFPARREYEAVCDGLNPISILEEISQLAQCPCQFVTDVGQHQMWAAQSLCLGPYDRFITSGGMGAMGFGLPAAIGAAMACPQKTTILITGDGSFQLNIQELETLRRNDLNIKIVLFNNYCHGMVRQFQETYFNGSLQSTMVGYSAPDFVLVSEAYGIPGMRLSSNCVTIDIISRFLSGGGPAILEVPLSKKSKVYPKLAFGRPFGDMEPDTTPISMEST